MGKTTSCNTTYQVYAGSNVCGILPAWCVSTNNPWLSNLKARVLCDQRPRVAHSLGDNNLDKGSIEAIVYMLSNNTTITSIGQVCSAAVHGVCLTKAVCVAFCIGAC